MFLYQFETELKNIVLFVKVSNILRNWSSELSNIEISFAKLCEIRNYL